jgi:hypothetical protein
MQYHQKDFLGIRVLMPLGFCIMLAFIFINAPRVSALSITDISNSPTVSAPGTFPYPTASLVNDNGTIYFITGTTKVPFTNYKAFTGLGYSLSNVVKGDLSNYSLSQSYVITTANAPHPWGSWLSYNKVVYYLNQDGMIGVPSAEIFLENQGQWNLVVAANKYDIAILKANSSLPVLAINDSRIMGQPTLQFGGPAAQSNPAPVTPVVSTPVVVPTPATTSTTTVISFLPQLILPTNLYASTSLTFSAPSPDPNGPLAYNFTWDDGTPSDSLLVSSAVHTYYIPGVYMLEVSVTDNKQTTYSTTVPVTIISPPSQTPTVPQVTFPTGAIVGTPTTVTATASDPQNLPLFFNFSWGDSSPNSLGIGGSSSHTYSSSDSFVVTVTATNSLGFSSSTTGYIYVAP